MRTLPSAERDRICCDYGINSYGSAERAEQWDSLQGGGIDSGSRMGGNDKYKIVSHQQSAAETP